ncbi:MAG: response regulator [Alistipes sp.]|nr:response regulator [Alistipes sp.]
MKPLCSTLVAIWFAILSLPTGVFGHGNNLRFIHLSNINELPSNTIHSICQDYKGFIWIGAENSLCRWDGHTMITYKSSSEKETYRIPSKSILKVYADQAKRVWVITSGGVRYYDYADDAFHAPENDIPELSYCAIAEAADQRLYLGVGDMLRTYNPDENRLEPIMVHQREVRGRFTALAIDKTGDVWAGTKTDGLIHMNGTHTVITRYHANNNMQDWLISNRITALYYSPNEDVLWIGSGDRGVCCYHITQKRFERIAELANIPITSFCEDADSNLWIGTTQGLYIYNPHTKAVIAHQLKSATSHNQLSDNFITDIFCDRERNMLIGTQYGGINIHPHMFRQFAFYDWGEGENFLSGRTVRQILPDQAGNLWIATEDGNLNKLLWAKNTIQTISIPGQESSNPYALLWDKRGRLWIGTTSNGLYCYTPKNNHFKQFTVEQYPGLSTNRILSLLEDQDGRLWVGTGSGLTLYNEQKNHFVQFEPGRFRKQMINHLRMDDEGNVWIATHSQGLFCYLKELQHMKEVKLFDAVGEPIRANKYINYIYQDSRRMLWISTNHHGLFRYDLQTERFTNYTTEDLLLSNTVYSVIEDNHGNIWISTDNGLSCFDHLSSTFVNYSVSEGLPNKQFSNNSVYRDPDGYLYFGTINGMIAFHPDSLQFSSNQAKVEFTALRVQGGVVDLDTQAVETRPIEDGGVIRLNSSQAKSLTISYTVPTISHASSLSFATSFGSETHWDYVGSQKHINLANLMAGEYLLQLKASFNNRWKGDEPITSLRIIVEPPFYRSTAFCIGYLILALALLFYCWHLFRIRQKRHTTALAEQLERKNAEEMHRMQLNFFANISHQLRIPISLIIGPLEAMIEKGMFAGDTERRMRLLARNATKMKLLVDELLLFAKIKTLQKTIRVREGDAQAFLLEITDEFQLLAEERGIDFRVSIAKAEHTVWFSPQDVEKIVFNLLSNAFKYTPHGSISFTSQLLTIADKQMLRITVEDTGIGIEEHELEHIFEAYYQINEWERKGQTGFGIGLALTRELVEQHKGTIEVHSTPNKGSCFCVTLCVDPSRFAPEQISPNRADKAYIGDYHFLSIDHERTFEAVNAPTPRPAKAAKRSTLLIVEDEPELLHFYQELFQEEYQVLTATNGQEGWAIAQKRIPDLIISDVMMPVMNGYEFTQRIKEHIATSHIQVLLLTAKSDSAMESYRMGADFYLEKPFRPSVLQEQVRNLIQSREQLVRRYIAGKAETTELTNNPYDVKFMTRIDTILKNNFANEYFSVNELMADAGMSRTQFYLKFKSLTGMSATEYINRYRLDKSLSLLKSGQRISEVAYASGFSSPNYYTRLFRKRFGFTPKEYLDKFNQQSPATEP